MRSEPPVFSRHIVFGPFGGLTTSSLLVADLVFAAMAFKRIELKRMGNRLPLRFWLARGDLFFLAFDSALPR